MHAYWVVLLDCQLLMALDLLQQEQHQSYISSLSTMDGAMAHGGLGMLFET